MPIHLIIARYNENIDWLYEILNRYMSIHITIYNKGEKLNIKNKKITEKCILNRGHEAHTFLLHIIQNYETLSEVNVFLQANIEDHIQGDKYKYVDKLIEDTLKVGKSQNAQTTIYNGYKFRIREYNKKQLNPYICNFGDFFTTHIQRDFPQNFLVYINALFAVSNTLIRKRPLYFYKMLYKLETNVHSELAHYMERSWYYMFV